MKVPLFLALREIRRRPRGFAALTAISAAIFTTLTMILLSLNAAHRADVMPLKPENYHFTLYGLTPHEETLLRIKPWVLATYCDAETGGLNVRVVRSENARALDLVWDFFDELDLWQREAYKERYDGYYYGTMRDMWTFYGGRTIIEKGVWRISEKNTLLDGTTYEDFAIPWAKYLLIKSDYVQNISYNRKCVDGYVMRPEFFALISIFSLFLCGASVVMTSERYRRRFSELGALRSIGLKKRQLVQLNVLETLLASLAALPLGGLLSAVILRLYRAIFADILADGSIYLTLEEHLPLGAMGIIAVMMCVSSLAGALVVCRIFRDKTAIELIRREGTVRVSWVAKTSRRFEWAKNPRIYERLATSRTKLTLALSVAVTVIMMPLPLGFLTRAVEILTSFEGSDGELAELGFYTFEAAAMYVTSIAVIAISARSHTEERHGELGILRALGMNRRVIRGTVFPRAVRQILLCAVPAVLLFMRLTDTTPRTSSANRRYGIVIPEFLTELGLLSLGVVVLVAPPILAGVARSLARFRKRTVVDCIRENE